MQKAALAALAALGVSCGLQLTASGGDKAGTPARSTKPDLTPASIEKLHTLIRPHENEWRHLNVHWLTDVVAARRQAAEQDKPIVICYTGGAGYNEPLGVC